MAPIRVERGHLAKRAFGLEVPETVQLADSLIEERLHGRHGAGDRQMNAAGPRHQKGVAARPIVEGIPILRVAGLASFALGRGMVGKSDPGDEPAR